MASWYSNILGHHPIQWFGPHVGSGEQPLFKVYDFTYRGICCGAFSLINTTRWYITRKPPPGYSLTQYFWKRVFRGTLYQGAAWGSFALTVETLAILRGKDDAKNFFVGGAVAGTIYGRLFAAPGVFLWPKPFPYFTLFGGILCAWFRVQNAVLTPDKDFVKFETRYPADWFPYQGEHNDTIRYYWRHRGSFGENKLYLSPFSLWRYFME